MNGQRGRSADDVPEVGRLSLVPQQPECSGGLHGEPMVEPVSNEITSHSALLDCWIKINHYPEITVLCLWEFKLLFTNFKKEASFTTEQDINYLLGKKN